MGNLTHVEMTLMAEWLSNHNMIKWMISCTYWGFPKVWFKHFIQVEKYTEKDWVRLHVNSDNTHFTICLAEKGLDWISNANLLLFPKVSAQYHQLFFKRFASQPFDKLVFSNAFFSPIVSFLFRVSLYLWAHQVYVCIHQQRSHYYHFINIPPVFRHLFS